MYILRLTNGDCIVAMAADERGALETAKKLIQDEAAGVTSVRRLDRFGVQFSPTEDGTLEVEHWDDATVDDILASEYPLLNEAYRRANAAPFIEAFDPEEPVLAQLQSAHDRNTEIIREGLRRELERFNREENPQKVDGDCSPPQIAHAKVASRKIR